jgi:hypothetical protein
MMPTPHCDQVSSRSHPILGYTMNDWKGGGCGLPPPTLRLHTVNIFIFPSCIFHFPAEDGGGKWIGTVGTRPQGLQACAWPLSLGPPFERCTLSPPGRQYFGNKSLEHSPGGVDQSVTISSMPSARDSKRSHARPGPSTARSTPPTGRTGAPRRIARRLFQVEFRAGCQAQCTP